MIKAREISVKNIVIFLIISFAVSAAYLLSRPRVAVTRNVPVFVGEEVVVNKAIRAIRAEGVVRAERAIKAQTAPLPKPAVALPIVPPTITFKVLPTYPATALEKGLEGAVLLSVYVGLTGQPERVETKTSSGISELDDSAAKAVSQWRFTPATQGGVALASWFEVPVSFRLMTH